MMANLMKTLEKHYPLTQFLRMIIIISINKILDRDWFSARIFVT